MRTHKYPPGPRGGRSCVVCSTKEEFEFRFPECAEASLPPVSWSPKNDVPCYRNHPPLSFGEGVVYGGRCAEPVVKDADVYVGLDKYTPMTPLEYPWTVGHSFRYEIVDMAAPKDPASFRALISFLCARLDSGETVHIGCIGGHGRTGTVLAALADAYGHAQPIAYIRKHYCSKAVESAAQINFLRKYYHGDDAAPTKVYSTTPYIPPSSFRNAEQDKPSVSISPIPRNTVWGS